MNIQLLQLSASAVRSLAEGDLEAANLATTVELRAYFVGPECRSTWRRRAAQIAEDPGSAVWLTRAVVDLDLGLVVGRAGFHGPPDASGMIEVGYAIEPAFRRRGYARAALLTLLRWARDEASIRTVRACVAPDNLASRALVIAQGFIEECVQWDDEDGPETVFELDVGSP